MPSRAGEIAEATSEAVSSFLHHATGQNVIVLDRKDSPDVEGAGGDST